MSKRNPFLAFQALGYTRLVPIIPPDAKISEKSTLFKRLNTPQDGRGKTPGVRNRDGLWSGFDWLPYEADDRDLERWSNMGAGVGIKTGDGLILIDADTMNEDHARTIRDAIRDQLGDMPVRVGNYPKAGYLCRVDGPFQYSRVEFGNRDDRNRLLERVEILSDGRQFVAEGVHPKTKRPYTWPKELTHFDDLPVFKPEQIAVLLQSLSAILPAASEVIREGAHTDVNQDALKGLAEHVSAAVAAIPNTSDMFPSRESYCGIGYAIKAALPDDERMAFEIFTGWCDRWQDGENDPDVVAADWARMKPPYRRGAGWLYELAERHGNGQFSTASVWFDDIPEPTNPFAELAAKQQPSDEPAANIRATPYGFPPPATIQPRQWLYGNHYIRKFVSATVAPSGVGKSSLEIVEGLVMASGKPLLGVEPKGQFRVWLWNGEDPRDELERRIAAAMMHYQLTPEDIGDRLFVDTGRETEIILATETRDGAKIYAPAAEAVLAEILKNRIDVFQIDPFVSSHRVSENDNGAIDMVSKQWARIADAGNCAIELVHHVRKLNGAEITVEDSRGAVALIATSRSARAITRMTPAEGASLGLEHVRRRLFRFGDGKNNLAPPIDEQTNWFQLASVPLGNGTGDAIDAAMTGDNVGVVQRFIVPDATAHVGTDEREAAFDAIRAGEWRRDLRSPDAWVGVAIARAMHLDVYDESDKAQLKTIISEWIKAGLLVEVTRPDAYRKPKTYVEVAKTKDILSENTGMKEPETSGGVFD